MVRFSPMLSKQLNFTNFNTIDCDFVFLDSTNNDSIFENNKCLSNHILLIFKLYVYKSREKKLINIDNLITEIRKVKRIEKETCFI